MAKKAVPILYMKKNQALFPAKDRNNLQPYNYVIVELYV